MDLFKKMLQMVLIPREKKVKVDDRNCDTNNKEIEQTNCNKPQKKFHYKISINKSHKNEDILENNKKSVDNSLYEQHGSYSSGINRKQTSIDLHLNQKILSDNCVQQCIDENYDEDTKTSSSKNTCYRSDKNNTKKTEYVNNTKLRARSEKKIEGGIKLNLNQKPANNNNSNTSSSPVILRKPKKFHGVLPDNCIVNTNEKGYKTSFEKQNENTTDVINLHLNQKSTNDHKYNANELPLLLQNARKSHEIASDNCSLNGETCYDKEPISSDSKTNVNHYYANNNDLNAIEEESNSENQNQSSSINHHQSSIGTIEGEEENIGNTKKSKKAKKKRKIKNVTFKMDRQSYMGDEILEFSLENKAIAQLREKLNALNINSKDSIDLLQNIMNDLGEQIYNFQEDQNKEERKQLNDILKAIVTIMSSFRLSLDIESLNKQQELVKSIIEYKKLLS